MNQGDDDKDQRSRPQRRPQDFSAEEKLRIVQRATNLPEDELGAFLRREGLHEADLAEWCEQANDAALAAQL
jgi:transposase-like protein